MVNGVKTTMVNGALTRPQAPNCGGAMQGRPDDMCVLMSRRPVQTTGRQKET